LIYIEGPTTTPPVSPAWQDTPFYMAMLSGAAADCSSGNGKGSVDLGASALPRGDGWPVDSALEPDFEPAWEGGLNIIPCARRAELVPLLALPLRFDEVEECVGEGGRGNASTGASELLITLRSVVRGATCTSDAGSPWLTGGRGWGDIGTPTGVTESDFLYPWRNETIAEKCAVCLEADTRRVWG